MSFSVNTNITSLQAQETLRQTSDFQAKTISRVTSGLRIVSSGDDAAGLAIANGFRSDQAVLSQGVRNANDGLSTLQTIDGGMSNISKLLDRARTLATQSGSGTFNGDRTVLNNEFKSVLAEIDRQAKAIGLDKGGVFAKNLTAFIGGGKADVGDAVAQHIIDNGTVSLDLSNSTVDAKSLGLKGVQTSIQTTDLSSSSSTSVQKIVQDTLNKTGGAATFYFAGAGFSDQNKVAVNVNLTGVTDTATLGAAINTAIENAGNGSTSAATAFKNAGITANIVSDSNGQHLAFSSGTAAFQVQAGDRMSNALLGNLAGSSATGSETAVSGQSVSATVTGAGNAIGTAVSHSITVRIIGAGIAGGYKDISLDSTTTGHQTISDLQSLVANDADLKAAGITLTTATAGSKLVFTSARGEQFSVATSGDTANELGLGAFQLGASSAFDYASFQGAALAGTTGGDVAKLEFSLNGAASSGTASTLTGTGAIFDASAQMSTTGKSLALTIDGKSFTVNFANDANVGATEDAADVVKYINAVANANGISGNVATTTGAADSTELVLTSPTIGTGGSAAVTSGGAAFGLTASAVAGTGVSAVKINYGSAATMNGNVDAATYAGAPMDGTHNALTITVNGYTAAGAAGVTAAQDITLDDVHDTTLELVAADINSQLGGAKASIVNGYLVLTSLDNGAGAGITIGTPAGNDATALVGLTSDAAATGSTFTGRQIADNLNQSFTADSRLQSAGLQASYDTSANALTITSSNETQFRLAASDVTGGAAANFGFTNSTAGFTGNTASTSKMSVANSAGASQSAAFDFSALTYGNEDQTITISANDSNGVQNSIAITLQNDLTAHNGGSIDEALNQINTKLQQSNVASLQNVVAVKDVSSGSEKIRFLSTDNSFTVSIGANAGSDGVGTAAQKGVSAAYTPPADGGSSADISTQDSAQKAVGALAAAVNALGQAQAVVGKGQNQFTYAVNLAQSQLSNLAAAESRIRDADLANEAANLTKAQILMQAGVAALAQANSAPQQILSLLKG